MCVRVPHRFRIIMLLSKSIKAGFENVLPLLRDRKLKPSCSRQQPFALISTNFTLYVGCYKKAIAKNVHTCQPYEPCKQLSSHTARETNPFFLGDCPNIVNNIVNLPSI